MTMHEWVEYAASAFLLIGAGIVLIGSIGLLRLPDALTQTHATGMIDTLGASMIIIGLALQASAVLISIKLAIVLFFLLFTGPTAGHALTRSILHYRQRPWKHPKQEGESPE